MRNLTVFYAYNIRVKPKINFSTVLHKFLVKCDSSLRICIWKSLCNELIIYSYNSHFIKRHWFVINVCLKHLFFTFNNIQTRGAIIYDSKVQALIKTLITTKVQIGNLKRKQGRKTFQHCSRYKHAVVNFECFSLNLQLFLYTISEQ